MARLTDEAKKLAAQYKSKIVSYAKFQDSVFFVPGGARDVEDQAKLSKIAATFQALTGQSVEAAADKMSWNAMLKILY